MYNLKQEMTEYNTFTLAVPDVDIKPQTYRYINLLSMITVISTQFW